MLSDINLDGIADIVLRGVGDLITGAFNQIVYADTNTAQSAPTSIRAMDAEFQQFFTEVSGYLEDPNYFYNSAPTITGVTTLPYGITSSPYIATDYLIYCNLQFGNCTYSYANPSFWLPANAGVSCVNLLTQWFYYGYTSTETLPDTYNVFCNPWSYFYIVYVYNVTAIKDYTVFNQDALSIAAVLGDTLDEGLITPESVSAAIISSILQSILMETILRDALSDDAIILDGEEGKTQEDRNTERLKVLIRLLGVLEKHIKSEEDLQQECSVNAWGNNPISQFTHYNRNTNQWDFTLGEIVNENPTEFKSPRDAATHNIGTSGNIEYRGAWNLGTGLYIGFQHIFNSSGNLVSYSTDPKNMGTFDFASPLNPWNWRSNHLQMDITPWLEWGNAPYPVDTSTREERITALYKECILNWSEYSLPLCLDYFHSFYDCLYEE